MKTNKNHKFAITAKKEALAKPQNGCLQPLNIICIIGFMLSSERVAGLPGQSS